ncbi:MAG: nucleoside deaminase [Clostridiales bacterium]|nr:nucleoside deaminase [Clostridiales bacterium]
MNREEIMRLALEEANKALQNGEVPVGAVVVRGEEIISLAHNMCEGMKDSTAHAEMLAIREAQKILGDWRLTDCDIYVTLEPCAMCTGAIANSRIRRVVYGARDERAGCVDSLYCLLDSPIVQNAPDIVSGVLEDECADILKKFFSERRER